MFKITKHRGILNNISLFLVNNLNNLKITRLTKLSFDIYNLKKNKKIVLTQVYRNLYLAYQLSYQMTWDDHRKNLELMVKIANKNKCRIIICNYHIINISINNFLREFSKERKIYFCDNEKRFKEYEEETGSIGDLLSEDNWHPNVKGYSIIAQNIYHCIKNIL